MFIVIEGVDGAGKSEQISRVYSYFASLGFDVEITREPGGTPAAEAIRNVLLDDSFEETIHSETEMLLFLASRNQHYKNKIKENLQKGKIVICDRYEPSTYVYQCMNDNSLFSSYNALKEAIGFKCEPDLTFVLDIPYEAYEERMISRGKRNRLDPSGKDDFDKIRNRYKEYCWLNPHAICIDGVGTMDEVFGRIKNHLVNESRL